MAKEEPSLTVGGNSNWNRHYGNKYSESSTNPLACPNTSASYSQVTCSAMFIAVLFKIVGKWKQPNCASTYGWIVTMCTSMHWYTVKLLRKIKLGNLQVNGTRKDYIERGNPDIEAQTSHVSSHLWFAPNLQMEV